MKREGKNICSARSAAIRLAACPTGRASSEMRRRFSLPARLVGHAVKRRNVPPSTARRIGTAVPPVLLLLLLLFAPAALARENIRLAVEPRRVQVLPGEPVRLELTVQADSAAPVRWRVPADPLLVLRAVEKLPLQRTQGGVIVHKRVVLWQALEPGAVAMKAISVETQGRKLLFPEITITVSDPGP